MCGITGIYIVNNPSEIQKDTLIKMRDSLIHRGPDDSGLYISPDKKLGLGFRRLAIIDLSAAGNQPMSNEDQTLWLIFNGEIYNFQEIKEDLIKKGHQFKSKTDSEVLLHLYEEKGEKCLDDLNGMFAFVIWDEKNKKLFASRDRLGIKPFYYYYKDGIFLFGSEIKAILENPIVKREPDLEGISHYLTFACTPAPFTLFKNIKKLPAAHFLTLDQIGHLETHRYWSPIQNTEYRIQNGQQEEQFYVAKTRELLQESIERQMVSDVPFGCFLSGGIDSSTNAVLMSQAMGKSVETFSISYKDFPQYDEFEYSRKINQILGSQSHEAVVGPKEFLSWIEEMAKKTDDPNGDWVCFPVYYLAKLFRDNNVIMGQVGEGSDELFCGYGTYMVFIKIWKKFWRWASRLPKFLKSIPYFVLCRFTPKNFAVLPKEFLRRLKDNKPLFFGGANAFSAYDKQFLYSASFKKQIAPDASDKVVENIYQEMQNTEYSIRNTKYDFLQHLLYLELNLRLPELLLMRVDKMVSISSIEARVPFLDHRIAELAFSIPMDLKIKNHSTKYILKQAVRGIIPDEIIDRKKKGFGAPVSEWLRENKEIQEKLINIIKNSKIHQLGIFNYSYINQLISDHLTGRHDNSFKIWNLVTLSLWYDNWIR
ncbi:MAG: asparagine synthase (glutamine-hydrolyzing) [Minisyncoccia bacterium]